MKPTEAKNAKSVEKSTLSEQRQQRRRREPVRLSLNVSSELNEVLEEIADQTGGSKSDVLRKAIALMEVAVAAQRAGKKFGVANEGQPLATEIVGLGWGKGHAG